jgi:transposase-like protein
MPERGPISPPAAELAQQAAALYDDGLSVRRIAAQLSLSPSRTRRLLQAAGVAMAPRGQGRARPTTRVPIPAEVVEQLATLYLERRLTRAEVAEHFGVSENRVRLWLRHLGIRTRTRGAANREDRARLATELLEELYVRRGHTADQVAEATGASRREVLDSLRDAGLPVRVPVPDGEQQHVLLEELYGDATVVAILTAHRIPLVPRPGPLHERFPVPAAVSDLLLKDLYEGCGLSTVQMELVTGQPAATLREALKRVGIPLRRAGGLSPFSRRCRGLPPEPGPDRR